MKWYLSHHNYQLLSSHYFFNSVRLAYALLCFVKSLCNLTSFSASYNVEADFVVLQSLHRKWGISPSIHHPLNRISAYLSAASLTNNKLPHLLFLYSCSLLTIKLN